MKTITAAFVLLLSFPFFAYSFESGKYSGIALDGQQLCEIEITQLEKSYIIHNYQCEDFVLGRKFTAEPKELFYGVTKKYYPEHKMTMTIEVKPNQYKMNYSNRKRSESYDEELTNTGNNSIHVTFSITHKSVFYPWFDVEMNRVQ